MTGMTGMNNTETRKKWDDADFAEGEKQSWCIRAIRVILGFRVSRVLIIEIQYFRVPRPATFPHNA